MAGRPGQQPGAAPQYSLPKFSAEEQWVQKKQGEFIQGDVRMLSGIDVEKPFQNVQDAVQRLLPFHVSGQLQLICCCCAGSAAGTGFFTLQDCIRAAQGNTFYHCSATDLLLLCTP
jgi:hypothetical protein